MTPKRECVMGEPPILCHGDSTLWSSPFPPSSALFHNLVSGFALWTLSLRSCFTKCSVVKKPRFLATPDHQNAAQTIGVTLWKALVLVLGISSRIPEMTALVLAGT